MLMMRSDFRSHHATHAHLAHPDHPDQPDHLATADDLDLPASPETTVNPAQPDPLAPTDLPDQPAQVRIALKSD